MNLEENYLDNLLKSVTNPEPEEDNSGITMDSIDTGVDMDMDIDIDGLDEAISAETETALAAEFNLDEATLDELPELSVDDIPSNDITSDDIPKDEEVLDELPVISSDDGVLDDKEETAVEDVNLDAEETTIEETTVEEVTIDDNTIDENNIQENNLDEITLDEDAVKEIDSEPLLDEKEEGKESVISDNDSLEDILSMLDDDSELAEINDMLQKADNKEPVQDDMMDLLNQMADDETIVEKDEEEDDGVPLPMQNAVQLQETDGFEEDSNEEEDIMYDSDKNVDEVEESVSHEPEMAEEMEQEIEQAQVKDEKKKKAKKEKIKKEKAKKEKKTDSEDEEAKGGILGKIFDVLTQDIVPEPTEEELAAEKEAKDAKKQENLSKKDEAKQAKAEAKKAKAEEKEAAKKVKAEENAKKKKEKDEAKQAKKEAKAAKKAELEAANKGKKIPKKYFAAAAIFGITVFAAVMLSTSFLSRQGYLQAARKDFYNEDYMAVYQDTYGMKLDDDESDGLIKARSEVIMKMERRYDSYQNNVKMGRDVEALDALIQGIATYDYINAQAEQYGVIDEVDAIEDNILDTLQAKYGLDETSARNIMNEEDDTEYTIELNTVLSNN